MMLAGANALQLDLAPCIAIAAWDLSLTVSDDMATIVLQLPDDTIDDGIGGKP